MPNFTQAFRDEVMRLARKEIKAHADSLRRSSAQHRRDIAEMKRQISELQRRVNFLEKRETRRVEETGEEVRGKQLRFSPAWLVKHREKVGLSAADYGKLIGVSGQTVYLWEQGRSKPRRAQLEKLVAVRGIGKRDALRRLELLEGS